MALEHRYRKIADPLGPGTKWMETADQKWNEQYQPERHGFHFEGLVVEARTCW